MNREKRTWILAGICCMTVVFSGCSGSKKTAEIQPQNIKIGVSVYDQYDTFMSEIISQLQSYTREKEKDWGISITSISKSTKASSAISTRGASLPIQVAPAVESMAKTHWPAFRKLAG